MKARKEEERIEEIKRNNPEFGYFSKCPKCGGIDGHELANEIIICEKCDTVYDEED